MSKWFLNWYRKQLLLSVLKNRSKNNDGEEIKYLFCC